MAGSTQRALSRPGRRTCVTSVIEWATVKALTTAIVPRIAWRGVAASADVPSRVRVRVRRPAPSSNAVRNARWS